MFELVELFSKFEYSLSTIDNWVFNGNRWSLRKEMSGEGGGSEIKRKGETKKNRDVRKM